MFSIRFFQNARKNKCSFSQKKKLKSGVDAYEKEPRKDPQKETIITFYILLHILFVIGIFLGTPEFAREFRTGGMLDGAS